MFGWLGRKSKRPPDSSTNGRLIYAVGDIHGRADLALKLIRAIFDDHARTAPTQRPLIVFLGDYIDRGKDSRGVIDLIIALTHEEGLDVLALRGNHEAVMLDFLRDASVGPGWASHGGAATLVSYGAKLPVSGAEAVAWQEASETLDAALPADHRAFLNGLQPHLVVGDYLFVHAGVRPGVPLDQQVERDTLWIREDFLHVERAAEQTIVHGHTPRPEPENLRWRIGVDTGAYATGVLTAVRLWNTERTFITTS